MDGVKTQDESLISKSENGRKPKKSKRLLKRPSLQQRFRMNTIVLISINGDSLTFDSIEAVAAHLNDPSVRNTKRGEAKNLRIVRSHLRNKTVFKINGVLHSLLYLSELKGLV